jgi:hypothetical protein
MTSLKTSAGPSLTSSTLGLRNSACCSCGDREIAAFQNFDTRRHRARLQKSRCRSISSNTSVGNGPRAAAPAGLLSDKASERPASSCPSSADSRIVSWYVSLRYRQMDSAYAARRISGKEKEHRHAHRRVYRTQHCLKNSHSLISQ